MPDKVYNIVAQETNENHLRGLVSLLGRLIQNDRSSLLGKLIHNDRKIDKAYLCRDAVEYIYRIKGEGQHFCGYRNTLMLLSGLDVDIKATIPFATQTVLDIQTLIERAWDMGYSSEGQIETGGIKDTRKHIGTAEVSHQTFAICLSILIIRSKVRALLESLKIPCEANVFPSSAGSKKPYKELLDYVEAYFSKASSDNIKTKVHQTSLPSIYLQRPHHSLTIVGLEKRHDGSRALLVFDPGYSPPTDVEKALRQDKAIKHPKSDLRAYRRGESHLKRYTRFEILHLDYVAQSSLT
ncbi:hypothetical protein MMC10_010739 [Thelotrema lepadinum]|nr:hypothetical protein [Thelotrema lepadinum]